MAQSPHFGLVIPFTCPLKGNGAFYVLPGVATSLSPMIRRVTYYGLYRIADEKSQSSSVLLCLGYCDVRVSPWVVPRILPVDYASLCGCVSKQKDIPARCWASPNVEDWT